MHGRMGYRLQARKNGKLNGMIKRLALPRGTCRVVVKESQGTIHAHPISEQEQGKC